MYYWLVFIVLEIARNWYMIEVKGTKPIYLQSFIIRGMAAILHGILIDVSNWEEYKPILLFQMVSFWILFDLGLNLVRGLPLLYKGESSGWLDSLPNPIYYSFKALAIILLICIFTGINIFDYVRI